MQRYTVYRTVNQVNGMFYIGVHKSVDPNDSYLGSGKRLKYALKKYGAENFKKEILFIFETKEEAYSKEKELVTEEVLDSGKCYNLKLGGEGGWDFASTSSNKRKGAIARNDKLWSDPNFRERNRLRMLGQTKKLVLEGKIKVPDRTGQPHTEKTKRKIGKANSIHQTGSGNSQFGTKWITDGILNKKIKKDQEIPDGWKSGRV